MEKETEQDLFICGGCKQQFTELLIFVDHKTSLACRKALGDEVVAKVPQPASRELEPANAHEATNVILGGCSQNSLVPQEHMTPRNLSRVITANPAAKPDSARSLNSTSSASRCTVDDRKRFVCGVENCTFRTAYLKDLHRHHRKHTGEKPFACDLCGSSFSRLDKLLTHKRIHSGEKPYKCSLCDYSCVEKGSLSKHSRVHNGERPFKCQICPYSAKDASQLTIHLRVHTGDAPYSCPCAPCSKTFKTQSDLKRHIRLHTGEKPFACTMCDYKCAISSNLKVHIRHSHAPKKPFVCVKCDFTSENKREYKSHLRTHSDQFVCELCHFSATEVEEYKLHFKTEHNSKPYTCRFCAASFMQLHVMRLHIRKEHPEFTSVVNPKSKGSNLRIVVADQNPKPYACPQCPMSFVVEDSLKSHLRMHTHIQAPAQYKTIPAPAPKAPAQPTISAANMSSPLLVTVNGQLSRVLAVLPSKHNDRFPIEPKDVASMDNHSNVMPVFMDGSQSAATSQLGSVIVTYMPTGHNQVMNAGPDSGILTSLEPSSNQELPSNMTGSETSLGSEVLLSVTDETGKIRYVYPRDLIAFKDNGDGRGGPSSLEAVIHMTVGEGAEPTQFTG